MRVVRFGYVRRCLEQLVLPLNNHTIARRQTVFDFDESIIFRSHNNLVLGVGVSVLHKNIPTTTLFQHRIQRNAKNVGDFFGMPERPAYPLETFPFTETEE